MKFTVDRVVFADAVAWVGKAADSVHSTIPIMSGMLINADEYGVHLACFDYEMSARATVPAAVADVGDCLVSATVLGKVIAAADADEVAVTLEETSLTIACGRDTWNLSLMPAYDYPSLPEMGEPAGTITADELTRAYKQVGSVVSKGKGALPQHSGLFFDVAGDVVNVVATDRVRLAVTQMVWNSPTREEFTAIVPTRLVAEFPAVGDVEVSVTRNSDGSVTLIGLSCAGRMSTIRVIDGSFPAWRTYFAAIAKKVEAAENAGTAAVVTVETDLLLRALVKAGAVIEDQGSIPAKIRMEVDHRGLFLSGGSLADTLADFSAPVNAEVAGESSFSLLFNLHLLRGAVAGLRCGQATISIASASAAVLILPVTDEGQEPTHRFIMQPLKNV